MNQLSGPVLKWIREGYPDGVPDDESPALLAVLQERIGGDRALDVLRRLHQDGVVSDAAAAALLPDDDQMRRVAAKLVLGGWPLAGVAWLREGYPGGVPEHDYMPLIALLERRLTRSEVKKIAKALRRADVSPAGPSDIAAAITEYTHTEPSENDLRRVRDQLAKKGWPVEFPDPDLD